MKPTTEQIEQAAKAYSESTSTSEQNEMGKYSGYIKGFNDAISLQPEWVSVTERLPDNRQMVMAYSYNGEAIARFKHGCFFLNDGLEAMHSVSDWMPLPQPPTK